MKLDCSEIFYSLQGEGSRAGNPTVFIRLQGCKTKHACAASGIVCDTEFESGQPLTIQELTDFITSIAPLCKDITWTGGEPLDQLTPEIAKHFSNLGYHQSIETSGLRPYIKGIDYWTVSPKVAEHIVEKNFPEGVDELRYVRHSGQAIPKPSIKAKHQYISPHSDGFTINRENLDYCVKLCKSHPDWKLSVQQHKLWQIL